VIPLKVDESTVREFQLQVREKDPVEITRVTCSAPYAAASLAPVESAEGMGRTYRLTLTIGPEAPMGRSIVLVTALTSSRREPQVRITATCEKGIVVQPASVYMGAVSPAPAAPVSQVVTLLRRERPFRIQKVESDDPNLTIRQEELQGSTQYRLTFTYQGGWAVGAFRGKVTITTDDARQPTLTIPVLANVVALGGTGQ
jgi:hypothetical protein